MRTRRMISDEIIGSDDFAELSVQAQALYMHLILKADIRGYVNKVKSTISAIDGLSMENLNELLNKKFVLKRSENLYLIKHWYIHNDIPTYVAEETTYLEDLKKLCFDENYAYTEKETERKVSESIREKKYKNKSKEKKIKENEIKLNEIKENKIINNNNENSPVDLHELNDDDLF